MARRQEERLVETIRERRQALGQELSALMALQPVRRAIRRRPMAWVVGVGMSGFVAARFLARPNGKSHRMLARGWIRGRLRETFLNLVFLGLREGSRQMAAQARAQGETRSADSDAVRPDATGDSPPRRPGFRTKPGIPQAAKVP